MGCWARQRLGPRTNTRRELLSSAQRAQLLALPTSLRELEERHSFTPSDLEYIGAHRTNSNRLGIAVQLCFLRHPEVAVDAGGTNPGTRVEDPALFSVTGILPSEIEELNKRALKMFGEILLSSEPPGKVQGASPKRGNTAFLEPC